MLRRFSSHPTDAVDDAGAAGPDDPTVFQASEDDTREEHRQNPNAGKMLGTVIAVAMLGAIVVGGVQWIERERDVVPDPVSWTSIVTADRVTGDLTLRYSDLAVAATTNHGPRVSAVLDGGGAVAVVLPNQVIVEPFDLLPTTLDIPQGHRVSALPTANDLSVVIGDDSGGNLAIVTDVAGLRPVVMDLGVFTDEPNPRYFPTDIRHDSAGTLFAIADTVNFQTVLVTPTSTTPVYLPDLALAVHPQLVVTSQTVGDRAEIGLFDPNGDRIRTISTPAVRGGAITADGERFVFVTKEGRIMRVTRTSNDLEDLGGLELPEGETVNTVATVGGGSRLWVRSDHTAYVVDLSGGIRGRWSANAPMTEEPLTMLSRCAVVHADGVSRLVSLLTGRELNEVTGITGMSRSDDGCLVTGVRSSDRSGVLVGEFEMVTLAGRRALALAPDATAVVLSSDTGPVIVDVDDLSAAIGGASPASVRALDTGDDLFVLVAGSIDP